MASILKHPATVTFLILLVLLVVVSLILVPWGKPPVPSVDAQRAAVESMPQAAVKAGKDFAAATRPGSYLSLAIGLIAALVLGLTPIGAAIIAFMGKPFNSHWLAEAVLGGIAIMFISSIITLPLAIWRHTVLVRYKISNQDWGSWVADLGKSYAVSLVLGGLLLAAFYTLVKFSPERWWMWAAGLGAVFVMLGSAVYPVVIEPIFNNFTPMQESPLRTRLLDMAERDSVPVKDVLIADASRRTNAVNAYVSGLGPTRRIVVYDTLLTKPEDEVASVVAHELAHAKNGDVWIGTTLGALGTATAVCVIAMLGSATGLLRRAGIDSITSVRGVALILAAIAVISLVTTPLQNMVSRNLELRADQHALELTNDPEAFEHMQVTLTESNLSDVDPPQLLHWFFGSHPTTAQRIALAQQFR